MVTKRLLKQHRKDKNYFDLSACRRVNSVFANQYGISGLLEGLIAPNCPCVVVCLFVLAGCWFVWMFFTLVQVAEVARQTTAVLQSGKLRHDLDLFGGDLSLCSSVLCLHLTKQFECFIYQYLVHSFLGEKLFSKVLVKR